MSERGESKNVKLRLNALREHLDNLATISPAELEAEQRRLIAAVESDREQCVLRRAEYWKTRRIVPSWVAAAAAVATAAVVAVVCGLLFYKTNGNQNLEPTSLFGLVRLHDKDAIFPGGLVSVSKAKGAKIVWPDSTAVWVHENARMRISEDETEQVDLIEGRLLAAVKPKSKGKSFRAKTPLGTVTVHGTVFSVSVSAARVTVRLYEGSVSFIGQGADLVLTPGFELDAEKGKGVKTRPMDDTGVLADLMIAEKTAELEGPSVPLLKLSRVEESLPSKPETALGEPRSTDETASRRVHKKQARLTKPAPGETSTDESSPSTDLFVDPSLNDIEVTPGTEPMVDSQGEKQESDPTRKIEVLMRRGDFEGCIRATDEYLQRFPNGPHAERVQFLKGCCQTKAGNLKSGREAFERYLIRFPEGRQWQKVNEILGE